MPGIRPSSPDPRWPSIPPAGLPGRVQLILVRPAVADAAAAIPRAGRHLAEPGPLQRHGLRQHHELPQRQLASDALQARCSRRHTRPGADTCPAPRTYRRSRCRQLPGCQRPAAGNARAAGRSPALPGLSRSRPGTPGLGPRQAGRQAPILGFEQRELGAGMRAFPAGEDPHRDRPAGELISVRADAQQRGQLGNVCLRPSKPATPSTRRR